MREHVQEYPDDLLITQIFQKKGRKTAKDIDELARLFVKKFSKEVYNHAGSHILGVLGYWDRGLAEDWMQEIFSSFFAPRAGGLKPKFELYNPTKSKFSEGWIPYFRRTYRNMLIDLVRNLKSDPHYTLVESVEADFEAPREAIDRDLLDRELGVKVRRAIALLPEKQRQAFTLIKLDNLSYKEAARVIGAKNVNTLKTNFRLAKQRLQKSLGPLYKTLD